MTLLPLLLLLLLLPLLLLLLPRNTPKLPSPRRQILKNKRLAARTRRLFGY